MLKHSIIKSTTMSAPLSAQGQMRPKQGGNKKALLMTLALTSLVDAFSILVIYLLLNTSNSSATLDINKGMNLPGATQSQALVEATVIKIQNGKYFLNGKQVRVSQLTQHLQSIEEVQKDQNDGIRPKVIIQADKTEDYRALNPIISRLGEVGFFQIRFAVFDEGRGL